jgi:hypothetical protein
MEGLFGITPPDFFDVDKKQRTIPARILGRTQMASCVYSILTNSGLEVRASILTAIKMKAPRIMYREFEEI